MGRGEAAGQSHPSIPDWMKDEDDTNDFKLSNTVEWSSQARGYKVTKRGVIVEVIPAGTRPDGEKYPNLAKAGSSRNHVSYVVKVNAQRSSGVFYWPRAKDLWLVI